MYLFMGRQRGLESWGLPGWKKKASLRSRIENYAVVLGMVERIV